ncbi:MAG: hypothetical protein WCF24_13095, partial [Acidimicrobiales bacterium]
SVPADATPRPLSALRAARDELVLGVVHSGEVGLGVGDDPQVQPGDILLIVERNRSLGST